MNLNVKGDALDSFLRAEISRQTPDCNHQSCGTLSKNEVSFIVTVLYILILEGLSKCHLGFHLTMIAL